MNETEQLTCEQRVSAEFEKEIRTLRALWATYCEDVEAYNEDEEARLSEYGLSFDYVAPNTFDDQPEGYWRYQISWGGPSDEFRFYGEMVNEWRAVIHRIEYWFMDWFDGASHTLHGDEFKFMDELLTSYFEPSLAYVRNEALEEA